MSRGRYRKSVARVSLGISSLEVNIGNKHLMAPALYNCQRSPGLQVGVVNDVIPLFEGKRASL